MKARWCVLIVTVCFGALIYNFVARASADPSNLPADLNSYVHTPAIRTVPQNDFVIEKFAKTDLTRKIVALTFRALLRASFYTFPDGRLNAVGINEKYVPRQLSVYFIDPDEDTGGLLAKYDVYSARSFPKLGIVLVNFGFIRKLAQMEPFVENRGRDPEKQVGEDKHGHTGDIVIVPIGDGPGEVKDLRPEKERKSNTSGFGDELFVAQSLLICTYVVMHEVGHIQHYSKLGEEGYRSTPPKDREAYADRYFANLFLDALTTDEEIRKVPGFVFSQITTGMLTYLSHQLLMETNKTATEIWMSKGHYTLADSILASHPPLAHRLLQVLYYINSEAEERSLDPAAKSEAKWYHGLLEQVTLRRSILP